MDVTGICVGSAIVAGIIFIILAMVRKRRLLVAREREILAYRVVEGVLKTRHEIHREILIDEARKCLSVISPRLSDWTYEINTAISQMKEQGRAEERMDRIYGRFPLDGDL
jgi:hypothetical protein